MPVCQRCGEDNPARARFCLACAAPLVSPALRREERKVVSVLFCDLVGFTSRSERLDIEDVRGLLAPYYARLRAELERFGGTVEKFIGDAVMALFGAPFAHEDDPERAVRAALSIREAIAQANETEPGLDLHIRIGVTTGEALVVLGARPSEGEGMASGDVVNTAARLQATAPIDGVLVDQSTYRATDRQIAYQPAEPVTARGKAEPVAVWQVLGPWASLGVDVDQAPQTALVGRERERDLLAHALARACGEQTPQLVTLVGVPGIGKSRLVFELLQQVEAEPEPTTWRQGRCLPYGEGVALWALGEVVKAQAGILESDAANERAAKLEQAVKGLVEEGDAAWVANQLRPLVGVAGGGATRGDGSGEAFAAWRRFLEALAESRPTVLVFEDLHWADDTLLDFLDHLIDWATDVPLLIVGTARPELLARRPGWGGGKANAATVSLSPLSEEDTARLVASLLGQELLPAELQAMLLGRAGGNPLYAEEYVRMLADRGFLRRTGAAWRLELTEDLPLPETVQGIIAARLDALAPADKSLLQDAAVVGKVGWLGALAALSDMDHSMIEQRLHALERKEFLRRERRSTVAAERQYAFRHVLVRDVAYSQLPRAARVDKHRRIAEWIETLSPDRAEDRAELLAHHYGTALELARVTRAADQIAQLQEPTRHSLVFAGDRAMTLDVARADSHYQHALGMMAANHPERAKVLAKAAEAARQTNRVGQAEQLFAQAIAEFQARGDRLGAGDAMVRQAKIFWQQGETARSRSTVIGALDLLEQESPGRELAAAYLEMGKDILTSGRPAEALDWLRKAVALADRLGADDIRQQALQYRGAARGETGDLRGLDDVRESVALGLQLGLGREAALAHANLGAELLEFEGPAAALQATEAGLALAEQRGIAELGQWLSASTVECLVDLGQWDAAMRLADQLLRQHPDLAKSYGGVGLIATKAYLLCYRGAGDEAGKHKEWFLSRGRHIGDLQIVAQVLTIAALVEQTRGDLTAATQLVEELERVTRDGPACYRANPLPDVARLCKAAGIPGFIQQFLKGADSPAARYQHCLVTAQAVLDEAQGDLEEAANRYTDAGGRWKDFGVVLEHGQALLGLGRCRAQLGHSDARDRLLDARGIFSQLGAGPLLAETDDWLQQVTAQTS
jgi:class 3 adenylate cyclase/tetratricopeptide (TPR) repeat protein